MKTRISAVAYRASLGGFLCLLAVTILVSHPTLPWNRQPVPTKWQLALQSALNTPQPYNVAAVPGGRTLTINGTVENTIKAALYKQMLSYSSKWATGVVMDVNSGAVVALTSLTNPNPSICMSDERCASTMQDSAVEPWEPGSVMKPLLLAAAFNQGTLSPSSSYYDPGYTYEQDRLYVDAEYFPPQVMSMQEILSYSLNTGAIHILRSLGHGDVNLQARDTWYDYLVNHYHFGTKTDLGLYGESAGHVRKPQGGREVITQYTGSAFGVGETVTPVQLVAAYATLVNGGVYYKPYIKGSKSTILSRSVVSSKVSTIMVGMLNQTLVYNEPAAQQPDYVVGAKSGTAPVSGGDDAYKLSTDDGTYIGYIGKTKPEYIMLIRLDEPNTTGFASDVARTLWAQISNQLIAKGQI